MLLQYFGNNCFNNFNNYSLIRNKLP